MKVAIVGSRGYENYKFVEKTMKLYCPDATCIVSGGARGADGLGRQYALEHDLEYIEYKPDWDKYGKVAGFMRNKDIVNEAEVVVAYWDGDSHGTKHSISCAYNQKKPTLIFNYTTGKILTLFWENFCKEFE